MILTPVSSASARRPLAVPASRALASSDGSRVLQCVHGITLTLPAGLGDTFAPQILMPAAQVWAGGVLNLALANGVTVNGATTNWRIERTPGSALPWMAWLQRETATNTYSLTVIGASLTTFDETAFLTLHSVGVN